MYTSLQAQDIHTCAELKSAGMLRMQKKNRAGAYANSLMNKYDVHFYFLDLNIERNSTVISGATTIGAKVTSVSLDTFCVELNPNLVIDSVMFNNQSISYSRSAAITYVLMPSAIPQSTNVYIKIYYHGNASVTGAGAIGNGFSTGTSTSWGNNVTWSLSEPYSAYEWFPCKQFLQDKADSAWVYVTTDSTNKVGSNGLLQGIDTGLPGNKVRYRWKTNYSIDYYLISVAVARYVEYTIYAHPSALPNDSIPIISYVYNNPSTLPAFKDDIDSMPMVLEYYSDLLGLYPFHEEKYGHCMAPFGGGMEHQTMTSVGNLGSFAVNSHELMHHWFGNHVTCKTWKDIYINEGFASYGEYLAYQQFRSQAAAQARMASVHNDILSDPSAMVYFTDTTDVGRIFDSRLTYNKGSAVTHTLRFILGDSLFYKGLREFQQNFSFSTASIDDLKASLEVSTGINLDDFFNQWIYGAGHPVFSGEYASDGSNIFLKITHTTSSGITPLFKTPLEIRCISGATDTIVKVNITSNSNTFILPSTLTINGLAIDPNNWILNQTGSITKNENLIPSLTASVEADSHFEIFPNPVHHLLHIQSNEPANVEFILSDINGRTIIQDKFTDQHSIDLSEIAAGLYILQLQTPWGLLQKKIIK
jgi:aminopeptidase N